MIVIRTRLLYLIISAVFFQSVFFGLGQIQNAELISRNNSESNGSEIRFISQNESHQSLGWLDEAEAHVPMAQDHTVLGADKWPENSTFHMIVIGDSIAWGAGLEQKEKYYYKVADWLQKNLMRPIDVTVFAHTGATLMEPKETEKKTHNFVHPDLSSWDPSLLDQVNNIGNPKDVDLILLSGGINDVNVNTILNPLTDPVQIRSLSKGIEESLQDILMKLLSKCTNSQIIVTSYYPIVSNDTSESALNVFANELMSVDSNSSDGKGFNLIKNLFGVKRIIYILSNNSNIFDYQSRLSISRAIEQANQYSTSNFKEKRVFFAPVNFPSNRSYGTNETWLWELTDPRTNNGRPINDHMYAYRVSLCEKALCDWNEKINAIGHPNVEGADEYNRSITNAISGTEKILL